MAPPALQPSLRGPGCALEAQPEQPGSLVCGAGAGAALEGCLAWPCRWVTSQQWFGRLRCLRDCRAASLRLMAGAPQWLPEAKRSSVACSPFP